MADLRVLGRPIAPQAWPLSAGLGVFALGLGLLGLPWIAGLLALLALLNLAFFRNPRRHPPSGERLAVAPADGRVVEAEALEALDDFVGRSVRIAIFLSILDVHVNRVPLAGKVRGLRRSGSRFLAAFRAEASDLNVRARLDIETPTGSRYAVSQITGLVARRIVCHAAAGSVLERGQPYGLICYGSRVEVVLPASSEVRVKPGDRVRAGETVIAEVRP
jgi:phosphatidylserine decarboxylase